MENSTLELMVLAGCAFVAGLVDSMVGGGGLIQLPALLNVFPTAPLSLLFGTNKFASFFGTSVSALHFVRQVRIPWHVVTGASVVAFFFSFLGSRSVSLLDPSVVRPCVIVLLFLVLGYTLARREIGRVHSLKCSARMRSIFGLVIGAVLGFYDGFFGPGTGSFLIFAFVVMVGFDFLHASASAKIVNMATNAASLAYFIPTGNVRYELAIGMAIANMSGSYLGARLAIRNGVVFVRGVFVVVVMALLVRLLWLTLGPGATILLSSDCGDSRDYESHAEKVGCSDRLMKEDRR